MLKYLLLLLTSTIFMSSNVKKIYAFSAQSRMQDWRIVNDGVMGGLSTSLLRLTDSGHGQFSGHVALANNGGFASVQLDAVVPLNSEIKYIIFRIKGDKKNYEFRLKSTLSQAESYVHLFKTSGEWQTIKIALAEFAPQYRGRKLNSANFNFSKIEQLSILIANKQEEDFELLLDYIGVE